MLFEGDLLKNIVAVAHFEELQQGGKKPVLGVYRGRFLIVISHKADNALDKLCQAIKGLRCRTLEQLGFLTTNSISIKPLKDKVDAYHYKQVETHKHDELKGLEGSYTKTKQVFAQEISQLASERDSLVRLKKTLSNELKELTCAIGQIQQNFNSIAEEYAIAQIVLHQKQEVENTLADLKEQQKLLEIDVKDLESDKSRLIPVRKALEQARSELDRLREDTDQSNFKQRIDDLKKRVSYLEYDNGRLASELDESKSKPPLVIFATTENGH